MVRMFRFFQKVSRDGELDGSIFKNVIHGIPAMEFNIFLHKGNYAVYIYVTGCMTVLTIKA